MESNINEVLQTLTDNGYIILQVKSTFGDLYFAVYKWQESYFNTAQSVDFNSVEGVDITKFIKTKTALYRNSKELLEHFENEVIEGKMLRLEFSKSVEWYKWSSPNNVNRNGFK